MSRKRRWILILMVMALLIGLMSGCSEDSDRKKRSKEDDEESNSQDVGFIGDFEVDSEMGGNKTTVEVLRSWMYNGVYELEFMKNGKKYCGIANATGKIFYYTDNYVDQEYGWGINFTPISENAGYLTESIEGKLVYTLVNYDGKQKTFSESDFDGVLGGGGGYLLVYKNTGNVAKEEYSYGVINSDGEWENPLTPGATMRHEGQYTYAGENTFIHYEYYGNRPHYIVYNYAKNTAIGFDDCALLIDQIKDGKFIVNFAGWSAEYTFPYDYYGIGKELEGSFLFSTDGTYEKIREVSKAFDRVATYEESGYLKIWDMETNNVAQYSTVSYDYIKDIDFSGEYGFLTIQGKDGKDYFTIINSSGKELVEPRVYEDRAIAFYEDRTAYKQNGCMVLIDNNGNYIVSEEDGYSSLSVAGNAAWGMKGDVAVCIDKDGNEIDFYVN